MILKINKVINKYHFWQEFKINDFIFFFVGVMLAVFLRIGFIDHISGDYAIFVAHWYDRLENSNNWSAFGKGVSNYTPAYSHLLSIATILPIQKLYAVKFISIFFDFLLAGVVSLIVRNKYQNIWIPKLSFLLVLFSPSVFLNSAAWGQCDVIYTFFLLISIYFAIDNRYFLSLIAFAISFCFKLQAIFLLPLFFILFLRGRFNIFYFLLIPLIYLLTIVPSYLSGRDFLTLLQIYTSQFDTFRGLSMNSVNFWEMMSGRNYNLFRECGIIFAISIVYLLCLAVHKSKKDISDKDFIIKISLLSVAITVFFLPKMHERYFFPTEVISIIYSFYFPKYFYIPILIIFASIPVYVSYLFGGNFNRAYAVLAMFIAITIITADLFICLYRNEKKS